MNALVNLADLQRKVFAYWSVTEMVRGKKDDARLHDLRAQARINLEITLARLEAGESASEVVIGEADREYYRDRAYYQLVRS